jgi:hypothetical protein
VQVGPDAQTLGVGEIGWLDRPSSNAPLPLHITADAAGTRVLLYAGQRQNEPTFHRGPFVAGSPEALARMHAEYRAGLFPLLSATHVAPS